MDTLLKWDKTPFADEYHQTNLVLLSQADKNI
jgi:hypothetical protein